jgi:hypothetical protein
LFPYAYISLYLVTITGACSYYDHGASLPGYPTSSVPSPQDVRGMPIPPRSRPLPPSIIPAVHDVRRTHRTPRASYPPYATRVGHIIPAIRNARRARRTRHAPRALYPPYATRVGHFVPAIRNARRALCTRRTQRASYPPYATCVRHIVPAVRNTHHTRHTRCALYSPYATRVVPADARAFVCALADGQARGNVLMCAMRRCRCRLM